MVDVDVLQDTVRVYACVGVGGMLSGRWHDVPRTHPQLAGWEAAGLVRRTGAHGEPPPERLGTQCCGSRA